ncbi:MAG: hypothetical protein EBR13_00065 [Rhodobacteraceae bacterium]|nr:hypothetical protein [Paracoccaceae bacterium]
MVFAFALSQSLPMCDAQNAQSWITAAACYSGHLGQKTAQARKNLSQWAHGALVWSGQTTYQVVQ